MKRNLLLKLIHDDNDLGQSNNYILDYLHFDLNKIIYSFGDHFNNPNENKISYFKKSKIHLFILLSRFLTFLFSLNKRNNRGQIILSSAYFDISDYKNNKIIIANPPWIFKKKQACLEYNIYSKSLKIHSKLNGNFKNLITEEFIIQVNNYKSDLTEFVKKYKISALFLPQDIGFFEKLAIDVFKELEIPTFNFIHGLPGIYNSSDYNRTDYLIVWGESIKNNFIKAGIDQNKIIVNGHPKFNNLVLSQNLKFGLDNILVLTKSLNGSQYSESVNIGDRSNLIYYLLTIKSVLKKNGVKNVRLRPHPSENIDWYYKFIDEEFFKRDNINIADSLKKSTLVIGGTSTVFLESLISGVNYVVYEPEIENKKLLDGFVAFPPFDGTNKKVPVAKTEIELNHIIENKIKVDNKVISELINPKFEFNKVIELIKKRE